MISSPKTARRAVIATTAICLVLVGPRAVWAQDQTVLQRGALPKPSPKPTSPPKISRKSDSPVSDAAPSKSAVPSTELNAAIQARLAVKRQLAAVGSRRYEAFTAYDPKLRALLKSASPQNESDVDFFHGMSFVLPRLGWIGGWHGKLLHSTDGGANWTEQESGGKVNLNAIAFIDDKTGFVAGFDGYVGRTTDGGAHWEAASPVGPYHLWALSCPDRVACWTAGQTNGIVFATDDAGARWAERSVPTAGAILSLQFRDRMKGYAACGDGLLFATTDGGLTWDLKLVHRGAALRSVYFVDDLNGWVAGDAGALLRTRDGGATWEDQSANIVMASIDRNNIAFNVVRFFDRDHGYAAGRFGAIATTKDGGVSWRLQYLGGTPNHSIYALAILNEKTALAAGNFGQIAVTTDGGSRWLQINGVETSVEAIVARYMAEHPDEAEPRPRFGRQTEPADPGQWPLSSIGGLWRDGVNFAECTGTLVAPRMVLTAATCLTARGQLVEPRNVHFSASIDKGIARFHSTAERFTVSPSFRPKEWDATQAGSNWALVILKDDLPLKPAPVRPLEDFKDPPESIAVMGYSTERVSLPSIARNCHVTNTSGFGDFTYDCLTSLALTGAPLFAILDGAPILVGISTGIELEPEPVDRRPIAVSASQFQGAINKALNK